MGCENRQIWRPSEAFGGDDVKTYLPRVVDLWHLIESYPHYEGAALGKMCSWSNWRPLSIQVVHFLDKLLLKGFIRKVHID